MTSLDPRQPIGDLRLVRKCAFLDEERASRRPQPKLVGGFLDKIMRQVRPAAVRVDGVPASQPGRQLDVLQAKWSETVGAPIANVSRVTSYRGGVLMVIVKTASVRTELEFARRHLIEALAEQGLPGVHEIRFRTGTTSMGKVDR